MVRLKYFAVLASIMLVLGSCSTKIEEPQLVTLTVSTSEDLFEAETKADVNLYTGAVTFEAEDQIGVINKETDRAFPLRVNSL